MEKEKNNFGPQMRKLFRTLHRDLSFFLTGMVLIYAISGLVMNHRKTFDPNFSIEQRTYILKEKLPAQQAITKEMVLKLLDPLQETAHYTQHYFPQADQLKVFLKGGSSLQVDLNTQKAVYEKLTPRLVIGSLTRLHYNPGRWWTFFSDCFAVGLLIIALTGLLMNRGSKGIWGRGGIELLLGILIPLFFLFS